MNQSPTWLVMFCLVFACPASAQEKSPWVGQRVLTKYGVALRVGKRIVDDQDRTFHLETMGIDRQSNRIYRVQSTRGTWLRLKDENSGGGGWVQARDVIPLRDAIDYFTDEINADPDWSLYNSRALVWEAKGEFDIAIGDFNEAIRLNPKEPIVYLNRGNVWNDKRDYDKAIADFDEAIRREPREPVAYINRRNSWNSKNEYGKAIADYGRAIRLNPTYTLAYRNRGLAWNNKKEYEKAIADFDRAIQLDPRDPWPYYARAWLWSTCPDDSHRDGKRAVESATRACELSGWNDPDFLRTLGMAYAEAGDFAKAVEWEEQARAHWKDAEVLRQSNARLKLYREKVPIPHEPGNRG